MVSKLKGRFFPCYYHINLVRRMQSFEQKDSSMKEYTKEFYKLDIHSRHIEYVVEKIARYLHGLRTYI